MSKIKMQNTKTYGIQLKQCLEFLNAYVKVKKDLNQSPKLAP